MVKAAEKAEESDAAGACLIDPLGRCLFVKRSDRGDHAGEWAFPGGKREIGETTEEALDRELEEEIGWREPGGRFVLWRLRDPDSRFTFTTFGQRIASPFVPALNDEHTDYAWLHPREAPKPLHPGVKKALKHSGLAYDADEHYALDRATVRTKDTEGRLHVALTNISKATVNPYYGREIPRWRELGLHPDRVYNLLRDPAELAKAAPTFNNLPLLARHTPVSAEDHQPQLVIGSTGTDAAFKAPYLQNSLVVWAKDAIDVIESGAQRELSCGYRYTADMTPGTYNGVAYDGVMRNIIGNHVALVKEGRAGPDVVVGDAKLGADEMKLSPEAVSVKKALEAHLAPMIAKDSKLPEGGIDLNGAFRNVTKDNYAARIPQIVADVEKVVAPFLAQDASLGELTQFLQALATVEGAPASRATGQDGEGMNVNAATGELEGAPALPEGDEPGGKDGCAPEKKGDGSAPPKPGAAPAAKPGGPAGAPAPKPAGAPAPAPAPAPHAAPAAPAPAAHAPGAPPAPHAPGAPAPVHAPPASPAVAPHPSPAPHAPGAPANPAGAQGGEAQEDGALLNQLKQFLAGKLSDQDFDAIGRIFAQHMQQPHGQQPPAAPPAQPVAPPPDGQGGNQPEFFGKPKGNQGEGKMDNEHANDAALQSAVKAATDAAVKVQKEIREAERAVRPYVGELSMAFDSAEEVYRAALKTMGVNVDNVHASALPVILEMQPKPGAKKEKPSVAMDSAGVDDFFAMYPGAANIQIG